VSGLPNLKYITARCKSIDYAKSGLSLKLWASHTAILRSPASGITVHICMYGRCTGIVSHHQLQRHFLLLMKLEPGSWNRSKRKSLKVLYYILNKILIGNKTQRNRCNHLMSTEQRIRLGYSNESGQTGTS
jgi:hypothetical protein